MDPLQIWMFDFEWLYGHIEANICCGVKARGPSILVQYSVVL